MLRVAKEYERLAEWALAASSHYPTTGPQVAGRSVAVMILFMESTGMGQAFAFLIGAVVVAGALFLAGPKYQIVMGENQTIVWRLNTFTGELAVCTSPDLPGAGCRFVPEAPTQR